MNFNEYKKITEGMTPVEKAFYDMLYSINAKLGRILAVGEDDTPDQLPGG